MLDLIRAALDGALPRVAAARREEAAVAVLAAVEEASRLELHDSLADPSWGLALFNTATLTAVWLVITGLLGVGRRYLDKPSKQLAFLAEASYPLYILHQTVIVVLAFYLVKLPGPWAVQWVALLAAVVAVTFGLYEVVRRVGVLRFCFGMRPRKKPALAEAVPTAT